MATSFILRSVDSNLWHRVKTRELAEKMTLTEVAISLFTAYADGLKLPKEKK